MACGLYSFWVLIYGKAIFPPLWGHIGRGCAGRGTAKEGSTQQRSLLWDRMVQAAPPYLPTGNKIKMGSSTIFSTAPMSTLEHGGRFPLGNSMPVFSPGQLDGRHRAQQIDAVAEAWGQWCV